MNSKNIAILVTVLMFGMVIIGQALTYYAVPDRFGASADASGSEIAYTVSTNSAVAYTVLAYDDAKEVERLFIYYDEGYAVYGITHDQQDRYIRQTTVELATRGFAGEINIVNAAGLYDALNDYAEGDAVLMTSGVLPSTVYSDTENKMFEWVGDGGTLYWIGYAIGAKYADGKDLADAPPTYQADIFGVGDCILMDDVRSSERSTDPLSSGLMLNNNNLEFGLSFDKISGAKSLGFEHKGYGSAVLVEIGDGMICVLGGGQGATERVSISQIISSGVTASSSVIDSVSGTIVRNTVTGTMDTAGASGVGIQIRIGEPNTVFARTFFF